MANYEFYIVDVFAMEKYTGNQLAIIKDAQDLSSEDMQKIAREINFSETTFIISYDLSDCSYDVRIFTPKEEIPFAGHPVLGTAFIINKEINKNCLEKLFLNLKVGKIEVLFDKNSENQDTIWMKQLPPTIINEYPTSIFSEILGLDKDEFLCEFPIMEISTGLPSIIVPLKSLQSVKRSKINRDLYFKFIKNTQAKTILVFSQETYIPKNDLNARVFADFYGVPEDAATGSANGCLAAYLLITDYFGSRSIDICVEQGFEIGRPSLLFLRSQEVNGLKQVMVGGKVIMVAKGHLL